MPRMNGLELLQNIEEDPSLCHIPVAILSSRGAEKMKKMVEIIMKLLEIKNNFD